MYKRLHKFILFALLLALPLQGLAAVLSHLACAVDDHAVAPSHAHEHGVNNMNDSDGAPANDAGHSSCQHAFFGAALTATPPTTFAPSPLVASISLLFTLFIPERPQRPPRA